MSFLILASLMIALLWSPQAAEACDFAAAMGACDGGGYVGGGDLVTPQSFSAVQYAQPVQAVQHVQRVQQVVQPVQYVQQVQRVQRVQQVVQPVQYVQQVQRVQKVHHVRRVRAVASPVAYAVQPVAAVLPRQVSSVERRGLFGRVRSRQTVTTF